LEIMREKMRRRKISSRSESANELRGKNRSRPILGIMPNGRKVMFESMASASYKMGTSPSAIGKAIRGDNHICGGWLWMRANGDEKAEEFSEDMLQFFELRKSRKSSSSRVTMEENDTPLIVLPGKRIKEGYLMLGMSPTICPICGMVMGSGPKATKHVYHCIGNRPYRIQHGVIKVLVDE